MDKTTVVIAPNAHFFKQWARERRIRPTTPECKLYRDDSGELYVPVYVDEGPRQTEKMRGVQVTEIENLMTPENQWYLTQKKKGAYLELLAFAKARKI